MDLLVVRGGRPLKGRVAVAGSKNASLPIMAASLMLDGPTILSGVPDLADVTTLAHVLRTLGMRVERVESGLPDRRPKKEQAPAESSRDILLNVEDESACVADYDLVRRMRASVCVLGPLIAKRGRAIVSLPGGCNIGDRPIDVHLRGLAALGADLRLERGYVVATAKRLRSAEVDLAGPRGSTVTGTANVLAAATLARGRTVLRNAAREPEIADLARFLVNAGASIDGIGHDTLEVTGVDALKATSYRVIPDRIEAATLMVAAAMTGGTIQLDGVVSEHLSSICKRLIDAGVRLDTSPPEANGLSSVRVSGPESVRPVDISTGPYPGFPTDAQAQWTALMTQATGTSRVTEDVFPDRFLHVAELARLGADITRFGTSAVVHGPTYLRGTNVMASDLRASAALILAALAASGETVIRRIYHLDRGYERLDAKLAALGADVTRRRDESSIAVAPPRPAA